MVRNPKQHLFWRRAATQRHGKTHGLAGPKSYFAVAGCSSRSNCSDRLFARVPGSKPRRWEFTSGLKRYAGERIGLLLATVERYNINAKQTGRNKERFREDAPELKILVGFIRWAQETQTWPKLLGPIQF